MDVGDIRGALGTRGWGEEKEVSPTSSLSPSLSPVRGRTPTMPSCQRDKWPHLASALVLNSIIPEAYNHFITLLLPTGLRGPASEEGRQTGRGVLLLQLRASRREGGVKKKKRVKICRLGSESRRTDDCVKRRLC